MASTIIKSFFGRPSFILRWGIAIILLMRSIPSIFQGHIQAFGDQYLRQVGFGDFGIILAWMVKISHILAAICLLLNRYVAIVSAITIIVLVIGAYLVHFPNGWFVIGLGTNGVEYNFLIILNLMYFIIDDWKKPRHRY